MLLLGQWVCLSESSRGRRCAHSEPGRPSMGQDDATRYVANAPAKVGRRRCRFRRWTRCPHRNEWMLVESAGNVRGCRAGSTEHNSRVPGALRTTANPAVEAILGANARIPGSAAAATSPTCECTGVFTRCHQSPPKPVSFSYRRPARWRLANAPPRSVVAIL